MGDAKYNNTKIIVLSQLEPDLDGISLNSSRVETAC
jgi:hypothetical protein